jgi:hypothetical protein
MANVPISNLTTTWNNVSTTFTGIKLNVTDTASAAGSLLMDLQVGGASRFNVGKGGEVRLSAGSKTNVSLTGIGNNSGIFFRSGTIFEASNGTNVYVSAQTSSFLLSSITSLSWSGGFPDITGGDLVLLRDAADTLAQRRGVNAQTFRLYNTFTDASNFERGFMRWNTNVLEFGTEAAGTGTAREVNLTAGGGFIRISGSATGGMAIGGAPEGNNRLSINPNVRFGGQALSLNPATTLGWSGTSWINDLNLVRVAAGIIGVRDSSTGGAAISLVEQTAPAAPAANGVYIYAEDDGAGKTRLMARFATGAAVQIAIEP